MNRYESYQDSGIPWLGEVPAHWGISRLKYEVTFNDEVLSDKTDLDYEILYVDISSVSINQGIAHKELMTFENSPSRARRIVRSGDVIVSTVRTYLKAIAQINHAEENLIVSTGFAVLRHKAELSPKFLGYWVQSENMINAIVAHSVGVSYPAINATDLVTLPIVKIPLIEQTAIADYLDNKLGEIDALISKQETLLEKLAEQRTAMITHAVTKGLNAHAPMKNSGVAWLGDVPEHWEIKKLKYLCKIVTGYTPSKNNDENYDENGFLWVKPDNLNDFSEIYETKEKISTLGLRDGSLIPRGSILVCSIGTIGKMGIAGKDLLTNQQINSFIFNEKVNELFRKYLVYSAKGIFEYMANDNVVRILNSNTQKNIFFIVPPLPEQIAIANYLDEQTAKIDRLSDTVNQTIARLKEYRSALITQAVTGKIKVI